MNAPTELISWFAQYVATGWAAFVAVCAANPWKISTVALLIGGVVWWLIDRIRKKFERRCRSPRCGKVFHQQRLPQMILKSDYTGGSETTPTKLSLSRVSRAILHKFFRPTRWNYFIYWECQTCGTTRLGLSELDKPFSWWKIAWRRAVHPAEFRIKPSLFVAHRMTQFLPSGLQPPSQKTTFRVSLPRRSCGLTPHTQPDSRH